MKITSSILLNLVLVTMLCASTFLTTTANKGEFDYDPWYDLNDDGVLDIADVVLITARYRKTGTPLNKTELLLDLLDRMDSLNFSLIDLQSRMELDISQSGMLLHLPYGATHSPLSAFTVDFNNILHWMDLDKDTLGNQTVVFVPEGATINVTGKFQTWEHGATIDQDFFIYSWTPSWPPPSGYYYPLYNGVPYGYPGVTIRFSFDLTVPSTPGVYYLYYCSGADYSMEDAVSRYTEPLWVPYAVITVCSSP